MKIREFKFENKHNLVFTEITAKLGPKRSELPYPYDIEKGIEELTGLKFSVFINSRFSDNLYNSSVNLVLRTEKFNSVEACKDIMDKVIEYLEQIEKETNILSIKCIEASWKLED